PNPGLYNWPHNNFLEIACELGLPALLIALAIFGTAVRDAIRQLRDTASPYFSFSLIAAALLLTGILNSTNTGDINSDRLTWLFVTLVFVVQAIRKNARGETRSESARVTATAFAHIERHPQTS
ncbi:MAG: O-antigen ligase family protein, partial [Candidatus Acidiferrales bacterium]